MRTTSVILSSWAPRTRKTLHTAFLLDDLQVANKCIIRMTIHHPVSVTLCHIYMPTCVY